MSRTVRAVAALVALMWPTAIVVGLSWPHRYCSVCDEGEEH